MVHEQGQDVLPQALLGRGGRFRGCMADAVDGMRKGKSEERKEKRKGKKRGKERKEFPWLKSRLPTLWTRSYYCETIGHISENTIIRYIEDQKKV